MVTMSKAFIKEGSSVIMKKTGLEKGTLVIYSSWTIQRLEA